MSSVMNTEDVRKSTLKSGLTISLEGFQESMKKTTSERFQAVRQMSKPNLDTVNDFLSQIEPQSSVIRSVSKYDNEPVPKHLYKQQVYKLHSSTRWHGFMNMTIALNAIQIGLAAEIPGSAADDVWQICEYAFTVIFAMEMIVAIAALRLHYFRNPWNYLDFGVANASIINAFILPLVNTGEEGSESSLQVVRVFRLLKLLRVAKLVNFIPELKQVVTGLFASIKAMFWVFILLLMFIYIAGIFCNETMGSSDAGYPAYSIQVLEDELVREFNNYLYFGSLSRSMSTLFNMVILAEWQEVVRPVAEYQPYMMPFFVCVAFLCSFGVLNVMIGIVVEYTTEAMQELKEEHHIETQKHQIKLASSLADIVFNVDANNDQRISIDELLNPQSTAALHEIIGSLGLPPGYSVEELFMMLDLDGNGYLSKLEFVQGIMRLIYCDQFQRDCIFRTAIGEVKYAVARSEDKLRQSFKQQLQETFTRLVHVIEQQHERDSRIGFNTNEFIVDDLQNTHAKDSLLPEHSESKAGVTQVHVRIVGTKVSDPSGQQKDLLSTENLVLEAIEVIPLNEKGGTSASLVNSDPQKANHVRDAALVTSRVTCDRKEVTWHALTKSLLPMKSTDAGFEFDASAAEEMVHTLARSHDVIGWMPVVNDRTCHGATQSKCTLCSATSLSNAIPL